MTDVKRNNVTAEVLRDLVDEQRIVYNWQQIELKRTQKSRHPARTGLAMAAALVLVGIVASIGYIATRTPQSAAHGTPLSFEISQSTRMIAVPSKATSERRIPLSDGSIISLAPGTSLEVVDNTPNLFRTTLHQGWVRYNVVPGHKRTWEINAELCRVVVMGTQFTVNRTPSTVDVKVHRGTVQVLGAVGDKQLATLTQGHSYTVRAQTPNTALQLAESDAEAQDVPKLKMAQPPKEKNHPLRTGAVAPRSTSGKAASRLAGMGASADVNVLLQQVDDARQHRQPQKAAKLLQRILNEHPLDPAVGLVALTLGKIRLDALHQPAKAAQAFQLAANAKGLPSPLREQALARSVEAYHRAGNIDAANKMSDTYSHLYPDGAWRSWIERWTEAR
ncbi:MAG: FecR domain-containing protein [Deltaproteobacteria bacterium]|nr:FecR domain-containing protein [Deltaproteobacteria bacterium]